MMRHQELAQSLLGMIDLFTGGALNKLSIFSMGIGPYITASIIMEISLPAQKSHVNGIESFWSFTKLRLAKLRGIRADYFFR